ncbi:hypothetical protein KPL76_01065 [Subtercola sp. PAMC28395]|uniref:hypothetical protein n=1 Tax=Subtercola sp. PAMC28395 TaxID=2846775 RepID=UPI001C0B7345|nr:hypothetical protein [Subtercola sp. PAMC28395]QWT24065.1 hypothetical protein KPL76_01065 [Subtercola sp. PAMC28395]
MSTDEHSAGEEAAAPLGTADASVPAPETSDSVAPAGDSAEHPVAEAVGPQQVTSPEPSGTTPRELSEPQPVAESRVTEAPVTESAVVAPPVVEPASPGPTVDSAVAPTAAVEHAAHSETHTPVTDGVAAAPVAPSEAPHAAPGAAPVAAAAAGAVGGAAIAYPAAAFAPPAAYAPPAGYATPVAYQTPPSELAARYPNGAPVEAYLPPGYVPPVPVVVPVLTPPKRRSNRGVGALIALAGAVVFAIVYALVSLAILSFSVAGSKVGSVLVQFMTSPAFYVPVIFFAIALILVVLIVNRASWWAYVFGGFLVAVVVYGAAILGALLAVQAWNFTPDQAAQFIRGLVMDPLTLAAAIVAREVTIWVGAWISSRGRKMKARNATDRDEYERKLADQTAAQNAAQYPQQAVATPLV